VPTNHLRRVVPTLLLSLAVTLAACGSDEPTGDPGGDQPSEGADASSEDAAAEPDAGSDPTADDAATGEADPAGPTIVSLSPTATELLFAMGAGDLVVAADEFSDHPPEAPTTELSGFEPNVEAILEYGPDLVVVTFDPGDLVPSLEAVGVEVLVQPTASSLEDTYAQTLELGVTTGRTSGAEQLVDAIAADLDALADPTLGEGLTYYHEISTDLYSATSATFVGDVYGLFGLENVADEAPDDFGSGFPQLSAEYLVEADPDVVFLACVELCGVTATSFGERDGFAGLTAVTTGAVFELDDDVAGRWGPRVVEYAETVRDALSSLRSG
jgi:iron complex transport system substrate-binding protein